ncbi:MAPEG family protein [Microvirga arsenatis]|uniref:MAPEG family protein n=1 Tax=Microvirga arsenatis TaxID=2692265 RepID=A0ABW9YSD6_9HYPH|nr:MAPEG family protein [Microvirga arsenatis]NBJ10164.1 MAPEG family protein [Microvirga arsenatis]NBJ23232.1 MAPEG family protein [Microvirga arsenatis]
MSISAVILPVLVQVGLTLVLLFALGRSRLATLKSGELKVRDIALGERVWPKRILQLQNSYQNQFELPVLFYALVALALITRKADMLFVVMAWMFVASRLVHAAIHVTSNKVPWRFQAFAVGVLILAAMWVIFGIRIFSAEAGA